MLSKHSFVHHTSDTMNSRGGRLGHEREIQKNYDVDGHVTSNLRANRLPNYRKIVRIGWL